MRWELADEDYPAVLRWRKFWLRGGDDETEFDLRLVLREVKAFFVMPFSGVDGVNMIYVVIRLCVHHSQKRSSRQDRRIGQF